MKKLFTLFAAALCCASMFAVEVVLPGKFTINADGDQVRFSSWSIQTKSDRVGITFNTVIGTEQYGSISTYGHYFAWGTGDDPGYTSYKIFFVDWGDYLVDGDGNLIDLQLRTLSADEWQYLLSGRENAEYLCGLAQITNKAGNGGYQGLMLFPDDAYAVSVGYSLEFSDDLEFVPYKNTKQFGFNYNQYTYEQWKQLEALGAVFLQATTIFVNNEPISGTLPDEMKDVIYWTSTSASNSGSSVPLAKALYINEVSYKKIDKVLVDTPRNFQLVVRLVHDVTAEEQGIENIATPADKARKVMMDGTLYIATPDGKIYNTTGVQVK